MDSGECWTVVFIGQTEDLEALALVPVVGEVQLGRHVGDLGRQADRLLLLFLPLNSSPCSSILTVFSPVNVWKESFLPSPPSMPGSNRNSYLMIR